MKLKYLLKSIAWDIFNPFLLKLKRGKRYPFPEEYIGINIGCGIDNPASWIGVDGGFTHYLINRFPAPMAKMVFKAFNMSKNYTFEEYHKKAKSFKLIHHELTGDLPFHDETVPRIFSSHFFEHLFQKDAEKLISECYRVLKKDGRIRICVPSLDEEISKLKSAIVEYEKGNVDPVQHFVTSNVVGYNSVYSNHRHMYNFNEMKNLLEGAGFTSVEKCSFGKGKMKDTEMLDTRDGLFVEAIKPS